MESGVAEGFVGVSLLLNFVLLLMRECGVHEESAGMGPTARIGIGPVHVHVLVPAGC